MANSKTTVCPKCEFVILNEKRTLLEGFFEKAEKLIGLAELFHRKFDLLSTALAFIFVLFFGLLCIGTLVNIPSLYNQHFAAFSCEVRPINNNDVWEVETNTRKFMSSKAEVLEVAKAYGCFERERNSDGK